METHVIRPCKRSEAGINMIELMITLLIILALAGGIFVSIDSNQLRSIAEGEMLQAQQNIRVAVTGIAAFIQQAGNNPLNNTQIDANAIVPQGANGVRVVTDTLGDSVGDKAHHSNSQGDPDGDSTDDYEDVIIQFNSSLRQIDLTANVNGVSQKSTLAKNISALSFDYLDGGGNVTAVASQIRAVRINITTSTVPPGGQFQGAAFKQGAYSLSSTVQIRSRGKIKA